ncbi:MAG TPA: tyrosine decarboxylase MfnA [Methanocella sp.]|nr:tyrosine decarboxylase MfnA [Methanocella sp.]
MWETGGDDAEILADLGEARKLDVPYSRVLSSMCTNPHPIAVRIHQEFVNTNLGDPKLFPGTAAIERRCIGLLGDLLHLPGAAGYMTTGGTESNIQALRTAIHLKQIDRYRANIVVPESVHYSFEKASQLLGISIRRAKLDDQMRADPGDMASLIDRDTIALVAVAGTTEFGQIDQIEAVGKLAQEYDLYLHVDAAFGGFVIPFMAKPVKFDFEVPGVKSIAIDPHKMGMSTIPSGGLLYRDESLLKQLEINVQYLTSMVQTSLAGTRSGASAASAYAVMRYLGREGYRQIVSRCIDNTVILKDHLIDMGLEPVIDPVLNIVTARVNDPQAIRKRLFEKSWYVSTTTHPCALRMVVMPHVTEDVVQGFITDLKTIV